MSNEENRIKPTAEKKAINLFNEALVNITYMDFQDLDSRRQKAKSLCMQTIGNIKISLYETSMFDAVPIHAIRGTEEFYTKVQEIIRKF